jgi:hypothetical protein
MPFKSWQAPATIRTFRYAGRGRRGYRFPPDYRTPKSYEDIHLRASGVLSLLADSARGDRCATGNRHGETFQIGERGSLRGFIPSRSFPHRGASAAGDGQSYARADDNRRYRQVGNPGEDTSCTYARLLAACRGPFQFFRTFRAESRSCLPTPCIAIASSILRKTQGF